MLLHQSLSTFERETEIYKVVVLHGRQGLAPGFSYTAICTRPPARPELRFFYAVRPQTSEGGIQALENHTIAVFPQLPTYEENKAVVVLLRHSVRTRDTPQMPHAAPRWVDMKRCPDTRREWASEEQVVTVFHAGPAYFTGCALHHILLQEICSTLYAFLHE